MIKLFKSWLEKLKKSDKPLKPDVERSADLGRRGEELGQPYRLAVHLLRTSVLINAVLGVAVIVLSASLVVVAHRENLRPFFVTADVASNRAFRVEPIAGNIPAFDLTAQAVVREYIVLRETINFIDDRSRWNKAAWYSKDNVHKDFVELMDGRDSPYNSFKQRDVTRSVEILSSPIVANNGGNSRTLLVEFRMNDHHKGKIIQRKVYQATIIVDTLNELIKYEDALMNPYGIGVISYTLAEKAEK